MELAVPLVALGGMYVLANKSKTGSSQDKTQESFAVQNRELAKHSGANHARVHPERPMKPVNVPNAPQFQANAPVPAGEPMNAIDADLRDEPGYFPNAGVAMDRYYIQATYEDEINKDKNIYMSLTGDPMTKENMKHNNMVPFFGSKVRGTTYDYSRHESQMDSLQGAGSTHIHKREQAPLFKPQQHMGWSHGTPNVSDFVQSRINPSMKISNVKPWEEERVGPGLNQQGGSMGSGGFNSGMEARERWMPRTVDELRVATNPKVTYDGVVLGGKSTVQNRGIHGRVEKNRPDTYFINTPDRYFTTTGIEKAQTARATEILRPENRSTTTREYFGTTQISEGKANRAPQNFRQSNRPELDAPVNHISNAHASGKYQVGPNDYGVQGYTAYHNGRSLTTTRQPNLGGISGIAKAVVAPLMDILRPSRKENTVGNLRPVGNVGTAVKESYVYNPADRAKTTIREMTEVNPYPANIGNREMQGYGHLTNEHQPVTQQRDSTSTEYVGTQGITRTQQARTYDAEYNGRLNPYKETLVQSRTSVGNHNLFNGYVNMKIDKFDEDRVQRHINAPHSGVKQAPSLTTYGRSTARSEYGQSIQMDRNQPEILDAFRSNPYTQSLHSWA